MAGEVAGHSYRAGERDALDDAKGPARRDEHAVNEEHDQHNRRRRKHCDWRVSREDQQDDACEKRGDQRGGARRVGEPLLQRVELDAVEGDEAAHLRRSSIQHSIGPLLDPPYNPIRGRVGVREALVCPHREYERDRRARSRVEEDSIAPPQPLSVAWQELLAHTLAKASIKELRCVREVGDWHATAHAGWRGAESTGKRQPEQQRLEWVLKTHVGPPRRDCDFLQETSQKRLRRSRAEVESRVARQWGGVQW
eukprot:1956917-Prymnesium_polylepis.1